MSQTLAVKSDFPSSEWVWPAAVAASLVAVPGAILILYQKKFGFHPAIIAFGAGVDVLFLISLAAITLLIGMARPPSQSRWCVTVLTAGLTFLISSVLIIYASAFVSNAFWGDTINYKIVLTFLSQAEAVLEFLPLSPHQRKVVLVLLVAGVAVLIALVFLGCRRIAQRLVSRAASWIGSEPAAARRNSLRLAGILGAIAILSGGACTGLAVWRNGVHLQGEPICSFFQLPFVSNVFQYDEARLAAGLEDANSLVNYPKLPIFEKKNVILIVSDALRADRMGVYGYGRDTTPFLSGLFAKGVLHRVDMALSTCSETFCGIASTLASRPFHQISFRNFKLHTLLRNLGYRVNFYLSGDHHAWNYLFDFYGDDVDEINDFRSLKSADFADDQNIIEALKTRVPYDGQPNLFYFHLMSSHVSGKKYPEYERFKPVFADGMRVMTFWNEMAGTNRIGDKVETAGRLGPGELEAISNRYDNGVAQTDGYMQRIFHALDEKGYLKGSIVVIIGDHGDGLDEHGHIGHTRYLYQEDIRVPLLIYDEERGHYRNDKFAIQLDVAPSIVDRLGLPVPPSWQGVSLLQPAKDRITLHQTRRGSNPCFALVSKSAATLMKYMRCGTDRANDQLFDLVADPGERTNLIAGAEPAQLAYFRKEFDSRFGTVANLCTRFECRD